MSSNLYFNARCLLDWLFERFFVNEEDFYFLKDIFTLRIYFFGIIFLIIPQTREFTIMLSPLMILLSGFYCLYPILSRGKKELKLMAFMLVVAISTIFIEVIGVYTGLIFGTYSYGEVLGFKIFDVPVIIGLNWVVVILGVTHLAKSLSSNKFPVAFYAGVLSVIFDFFLEPVAIKLNYWSWEKTSVPLQNYAAWFFITFTFSFLLQKLSSNDYSRRSGNAIIYQILFFITLGLFDFSR